MTSLKGLIYLAALALLAFVCHSANGAGSDDDHDGDVSALAISVDARGDDTASIPDFDGDGTIGCGDFVIFASAFGSSEGDEAYDETYDLNGNGEIGFSDFVIFAQNFGKEAPSPVVTIPDANIRAAIKAALDKPSGVPITQAEMKMLNSIDTPGWDWPDISDLTGLESATNLTLLNLSHHKLEDMSALSHLTSLTDLNLGFNRIWDVSALRDLTNLTELDVRGNPLDESSINHHIPSLESYGATVRFESFRKGDFDIELVFLDEFTEDQKNVLRYAVRRWMSIIVEDLPDCEFTRGWSEACGDRLVRYLLRGADRRPANLCGQPRSRSTGVGSCKYVARDPSARLRMHVFQHVIA